MKKVISICVLLLVVHLTNAQQQQWKELTAFHNIMSATYHPAEENNLKPLKDSSAVLVQRAKQWKLSVIPAGFDAAAIQPLLIKLLNEAELLHAAVKKKAPDAELIKQITNLHKTFHSVEEECNEH